jgi:hypothetical protein
MRRWETAEDASNQQISAKIRTLIGAEKRSIAIQKLKKRMVAAAQKRQQKATGSSRQKGHERPSTLLLITRPIKL